MIGTVKFRRVCASAEYHLLKLFFKTPTCVAFVLKFNVVSTCSPEVNLHRQASKMQQIDHSYICMLYFTYELQRPAAYTASHLAKVG